MHFHTANTYAKVHARTSSFTVTMFITQQTTNVIASTNTSERLVALIFEILLAQITVAP